MRSYFTYALLVMATFGGSGCAALLSPREPAGERIYTVSKGDTVDRIAKRSGVPVDAIISHNRLRNPSDLRVGQIVKIPSLGPMSVDSSFEPEAKQVGVRRISISQVRGYVGALSFPVRGAQFTSPFGWRGEKFHEGADFAAPKGTPVYAAHDGVVILASNSHGKYGKIVVIQGEGLLTVYGHHSRNRVRTGETVSKGERIADVGDTGRTTGPHLHFETRVLDSEGRYSAVDPYVFFVRLRES